MNISPYTPKPACVSPNMPLEDFVAEVFWPAKEHLRASTKKGYRRDLARILPALGHLPLSDVRHLAIQYLMDACATAKMAKNARATLSIVLSLACDLEVLTVNHASSSYRYPDVIPGEKSKDQGVVLTSFDAIIDYLAKLKRTVPGSPLERASLLGLGSGFRKGEIFGMDKELIALDLKLASVVQTYVDGEEGFVLLPPKTPNSKRQSPLIDYVCERVSELADRPGPFVFNGRGDRQNPETASKMLKKWRERHRMPAVTFGSMRHSFATACVKAGVPVADLSLWLGHSSPNVTQQSYIKPSVEDLIGDALMISNYIRCRNGDGGNAFGDSQIVIPDPKLFSSNDEYLDLLLAS